MMQENPSISSEFRLWNPKILVEGNSSVVLLILNQPLEQYVQHFIKKHWKLAVLRIAVDGGLEQLNLMSSDECLIPDIVCGDFDSVSHSTLSSFEKMGAKIICTPDQDYTDFTKALKICFEILSSKNIKVDGILAISKNGDRLDHIFGNLNTLYEAAALSPVPVFILGTNSLTWLLEEGKHKILVCEEMSKGHVGLIPLGEPCTDITTTGELNEECSLLTNDLNKIGHLVFEFQDDPVLLDVHVYSTTEFQGAPQESEEMKPKWFKIEEIPYDKMWADDKFWFPLFLKGAKFQGYFKFQGHEKIIDYNLKEVPTLNDVVL